MTRSAVFSLCLRASLLMVGGLALTDCVVTGTAQARPATYAVRPATTTVTTVQPQPVYAQPQPVYVQQPQPVYTAPQPVAPPPVVAGGMVGGGVVVGAGWTTNGYVESDFVSYNMTMRARQYAAGMVPVTQLYRAQMGQGQREFVTVTTAPGRCYRIIGVGGPGVQDLDLRMRDMNGNVVDQDVATDNFPVLGLNRQLCPTWTGTFQIEIIMYSGGGEIGVQAFATQ